jgi:RNA polymerase sigma factor (TIGR02999 family)
MVSQGEITRLLHAASSGSAEALNELFPAVYEELRTLAASHLRGERPDHTLQPTALVNEVYVRLVGQQTAGWRSQGQFFGVAAKAMRRILVDHARARRTLKRSATRTHLSLDEAVVDFQRRSADLEALDEALTALARVDARKAKVVELRFFGGLTAEQTAEMLETSLRTVNRDWELAKAWLYAQTQEKPPPPAPPADSPDSKGP